MENALWCHDGSYRKEQGGNWCFSKCRRRGPLCEEAAHSGAVGVVALTRCWGSGMLACIHVSVGMKGKAMQLPTLSATGDGL